MQLAAHDAPKDLSVLLERIRSEFTEMPGLRLTHGQACRLWALPAGSEAVLRALVDVGFLRRTIDGAYTRAF